MNPSTLLLAEIATAVNLGAVLINLGIHIATVRQNRERIEKIEAAVLKMTDAIAVHGERITRVEEKVNGFASSKFSSKHSEQHHRDRKMES